MPTVRPIALKPHFVVGAAMVAAAALAGAALIQRGPVPPDPTAPLPIAAPLPVTLPDGRALHVQRDEVTVAEWSRCHAAGACTLSVAAPPGFDAATTPATGLSYLDASEYLAWIAAATGHPFRLPTLAEWEAMAAPVLPEAPDPIFTDPALTWASTYLTDRTAPRSLRPQGSFSTSPEGVRDLDGSVWEWTQDCFAGDGTVPDPDRCPAYFMGGEHVSAMAFLVRDPARGGCAAGAPPAHLGLRLVSDEAF